MSIELIVYPLWRLIDVDSNRNQIHCQTLTCLCEKNVSAIDRNLACLSHSRPQELSHVYREN